MGRGLPRGAGVGSVGVSEGDVDAGEFFVLKDVADDAVDADVGADGELADAVGVLVGVGVGPEVPLEGFIFAGDASNAVAFDVDGEGLIAEDAVAGAEEVAYDAVDDEDTVDFAGRGEALAAREVAPFFGADDAGGFEPAVVGIELGVDVGAGGGGCANVSGGADFFEDGLREAVDGEEVGAHALGHDLWGDVDHVGVTHAAAVDDVGHLHAAMQLVGLDFDGEDADLRGLHVVEDGRRKIDEWAGGEGFEDEGVPGATDAVEFRDERGGDGEAALVGDEGDLFVGLDAQAGGDRVASAGGELGGEGGGAEVWCCLCCLIHHGYGLPGVAFLSGYRFLGIFTEC